MNLASQTPASGEVLRQEVNHVWILGKGSLESKNEITAVYLAKPPPLPAIYLSFAVSINR